MTLFESLSNSSNNLNVDFGLIWPSIAFFTSLIVSYFSYPVIIRVSKLKKLMADVNARSSHSIKTPNLGGIGIFLAINLIITILGNYFGDSSLLNILGAMTIMFFVGLVDDLIGISPKSKIIGQIVASLYITLSTNIRIENLHGLLGIHELPYVVSIALTVMLFVTLINAYNLIDGVDGLAGVFAITVNVFFGAFFYFNQNYSMYFLSISVVGSLIAFLMFNFSKNDKVFMGDTGSMVIGFLLAYQSVYFLSTDFTGGVALLNAKTPIYFLALFSFPFIDTIRVFFIRLKAGKSPFAADKNHIHHILLGYGLKHWQVAFSIAMFTLTIIGGILMFNELSINKMFFALGLMWLTSALIISNINLATLIGKLQFERLKVRKVNFKESSKALPYLRKTA